jgi:putative tricarboxylic transport membrane protein
MNEAIQTALAETLTWKVIGVVFVTAAYGIFVGAIPGLTATMAVALLVPFTFFLDDVSAIAAIVSTVTCSIFAGDIPGTLLRIPGTPASAAYALDAYAMTQRGQSGRALGISLVFSVFGGLFGVSVLLLAAPQLAKLDFKTYEYFWLCVLGLSCAALVSRESRSKGLFALSLGLLISTIGLSPDHGVSRFDFGFSELYGGVKFIPAMIGLFGISEVLRNVLWLNRREVQALAVPPEQQAQAGAVRRWLVEPISDVFGGVFGLLAKRIVHAMRSSALGSFIGMLPGAGADLAAWISYAVSKRFARRPEEYGSGSTEGLADATTANNAALASAWIPSLVFGIPGDSVTAIALGVLLMKNIEPGPRIFTDPAQQPLVFAIVIGFLLANLVLLPIGFLAIRAGTLLVRVPRRVLMPLIVLFCVLGAYSIDGSTFDIWVMLAMGLLGFVLEGFGIPLGPVVLGIILGGELEHRFIQSLRTSQHWWDFFTRPMSMVLAASVVLLWFGPLLVRVVRRLRKNPKTI